MKEFPIANEFGLALALVGMFLALLSLMAILVVCLTCGDIFYIVYALLVFLMVVAEITLCILFLNSNSVLHKNIKEDLKEKVRNEYVDQGNDTFSETLNLIHVYTYSSRTQPCLEVHTPSPTSSLSVFNENIVDPMGN
nr:23 kDa integral membrane protein-like; partial [Biomphalaria glabrata]